MPELALETIKKGTEGVRTAPWFGPFLCMEDLSGEFKERSGWPEVGKPSVKRMLNMMRAASAWEFMYGHPRFADMSAQDKIDLLFRRGLIGSLVELECGFRMLMDSPWHIVAVDSAYCDPDNRTMIFFAPQSGDLPLVSAVVCESRSESLRLLDNLNMSPEDNWRGLQGGDASSGVL